MNQACPEWKSENPTPCPLMELAARLRVPTIQLLRDGECIEVAPEILRLLPAVQARKLRAIPLSRAGSSIAVAMANPNDLNAIDEIAFRTGLRVEAFAAHPEHIRPAISHLYRAREDDTLRKLEKILMQLTPEAESVEEVFLDVSDMKGPDNIVADKHGVYFIGDIDQYRVPKSWMPKPTEAE